MKQSQLSQTRRIISARQIQELAKNGRPVFLAIVRQTNDAPQKMGKNKRSLHCVAIFTAAHGTTEGEKRKTNMGNWPEKRYNYCSRARTSSS